MTHKLLLRPSHTPTQTPENVAPFCHLRGVPMAIPIPNPLDPNQATISPQFASIPCCKETCTMWNKDAGECWDVTARKSIPLIGSYLHKITVQIEQLDGLMRVSDNHQ
jgi:hypothetical protein